MANKGPSISSRVKRQGAIKVVHSMEFMMVMINIAGASRSQLSIARVVSSPIAITSSLETSVI